MSLALLLKLLLLLVKPSNRFQERRATWPTTATAAAAAKKRFAPEEPGTEPRFLQLAVDQDDRQGEADFPFQQLHPFGRYLRRGTRQPAAENSGAQIRLVR